MSEKKPGKVIEFSAQTDKADARREARREAKANTLQKRFTAARRGTESKSKAAKRLQKLFKKPSAGRPKKH